MVKVVGTTKVEYRGLQKKLLKTQQAIIKQGTATVQTLGDIGRMKAKSIAPFWSGKTAKAIRTINLLGNRPSSRIVSPNMYPHPSSEVEGGVFNLPRWLHTSRNAKMRPSKSGNYQYMYETTRWLNQKKKGVAKGHFSNINIK